jgi:hypothetical protein
VILDFYNYFVYPNPNPNGYVTHVDLVDWNHIQNRLCICMSLRTREYRLDSWYRSSSLHTVVQAPNTLLLCQYHQTRSEKKGYADLATAKNGHRMPGPSGLWRRSIAIRATMCTCSLKTHAVTATRSPPRATKRYVLVAQMETKQGKQDQRKGARIVTVAERCQLDGRVRTERRRGGAYR